MKKIIMKVGLIIMALTTMVTMSACSKINNDTANDVCSALSEKYGESFVAVKLVIASILIVQNFMFILQIMKTFYSQLELTRTPVQ